MSGMLAGAIDESATKDVIAYGGVFGEPLDLSYAYDSLRRHYDRVARSYAGVSWSGELKASKMLKALFGRGLGMDAVADAFFKSGLKILRDSGVLIRGIVLERGSEDELIAAAGLADFRSFSRRARLISGVLRLMLIGVPQVARIALDKGILIRRNEVAAVLARLCVRAKLEEVNSQESREAQLADFVASAVRFLDFERNAVITRGLVLIEFKK